jgi:hypothetical protein
MDNGYLKFSPLFTLTDARIISTNLINPKIPINEIPPNKPNILGKAKLKLSCI